MDRSRELYNFSYSLTNHILNLALISLVLTSEGKLRDFWSIKISRKKKEKRGVCVSRSLWSKVIIPIGGGESVPRNSVRGCLLVGINYRKVHPSKIPVLAHEAYSIRNCLSKTRELLPHGVLASPSPPLGFRLFGLSSFARASSLSHTRLALWEMSRPVVISSHDTLNKRKGEERRKKEAFSFEKAYTVCSTGRREERDGCKRWPRWRCNRCWAGRQRGENYDEACLLLVYCEYWGRIVNLELEEIERFKIVWYTFGNLENN